MIITSVKNEVFTKFASGNITGGRDRLLELMSELNSNSSTEEKRMVIYNLSVACRILGDEQGAKFYIKQIKNIIDSDDIYKNSNETKGGYTDVLIFYMDYYFMDKSEKRKVYSDNYEFYMNIPDKLDRALMSESNMYLLDENYREVYETLCTLHNCMMENKDDENLLGNLKFVRNEVINDLKIHSTSYYNKITEFLNASILG